MAPKMRHIFWVFSRNPERSSIIDAMADSIHHVNPTLQALV